VVRFSGELGAAPPLLLSGRLDVAFGRAEGLGQALPAPKHPGLEIDASSGNDLAPEWVDAAEQLLRRFGARPTPPHPQVRHGVRRRVGVVPTHTSGIYLS